MSEATLVSMLLAKGIKPSDTFDPTAFRDIIRRHFSQPMPMPAHILNTAVAQYSVDSFVHTKRLIRDLRFMVSEEEHTYQQRQQQQQQKQQLLQLQQQQQQKLQQQQQQQPLISPPNRVGGDANKVHAKTKAHRRQLLRSKLDFSKDPFTVVADSSQSSSSTVLVSKSSKNTRTAMNTSVESDFWDHQSGSSATTLFQRRGGDPKNNLSRRINWAEMGPTGRGNGSNPSPWEGRRLGTN
jgi:hypothetical protein